MQSPLMTKYGFRIRTRVGCVVDKLMIPGRDAIEARVKLRQIYRDCEILECFRHHDGVRTRVPHEDETTVLSSVQGR